MLVTGKVLWWPHNKKALRIRTWFRWNPKTKWKRKNYNLHQILAIYSALILLIIALTGLVWAFQWVDYSVQWMANGGKEVRRDTSSLISVPTVEAESGVMDRIIANINTINRELKSAYIVIPRLEKEPIHVYVRKREDINEYHEIYYRSSGRCLERLHTDDLSNGEKLLWLNYGIHVGSILGLPGKILAFFASLISASLPVTGFLIWWGKRRKGKQKPKTKKYPKLTLVPEPQKSLAGHVSVAYMNTGVKDNDRTNK